MELMVPAIEHGSLPERRARREEIVGRYRCGGASYGYAVTFGAGARGVAGGDPATSERKGMP